jgi:hypothetical protein
VRVGFLQRALISFFLDENMKIATWRVTKSGENATASQRAIKKRGMPRRYSTAYHVSQINKLEKVSLLNPANPANPANPDSFKIAHRALFLRFS